MPITALPAPPSRQDATNFATRADTFMTALPVFATEANTLQTDVNTKQTAAASSATAAATSATNSANSATGSASSATAAATSATNSANSATGASTSKTGADNTLASFTQRYLGAKSVEPTLDNTGAALLTGALYFDTVIGGGTLRVWGGLAWANLPATTAAAIANTPAGSITETNVQGALNGLGTRKVETSINLAIGTNLNSVVTSGFYRMLGTPVNGPTGVADSQLIVSRGVDTIAQIVIIYSSGIVYVRSGNPPDVGGIGTWSAWIQQATTADVALKANAGANTDITSLASLTSINGGQLAGMRNRIINGACNIAQRGSFVATLNTSGYGGPDRFYAQNSAAGGQFTQAASTLTFGGVARNAIRQTVDVATTAFTASNYWHGFQQRIEGFNSYDLKGKPVSVSFIFNTNLTGTYSVALRDNPTSQSYVTSFAATANVPVKVTIPAPTIPLSLSIPGTNAVGLDVTVGFQNQATYQATTLNAWQVGNFVSATGATIWAAAAGNFIELTELQLDEGSVATPFERRSIAQELALCQRYYEVASAGALTSAVSGQYCGFPVYWKALKRAVPSIVTTVLFNSAGGTPGVFDVKDYGAIVYTTAAASGNAELRTSLAVSAEL